MLVKGATGIYERTTRMVSVFISTTAHEYAYKGNKPRIQIFTSGIYKVQCLYVYCPGRWQCHKYPF